MDLTAATAELAIPVSLVTGWDDVQLDQTLGQYRRLPRGRRRCPADRRPLEPHLHLRQGLPRGRSPGRWRSSRTRLSGQPGCPAGQPVRVHVGGSGAVARPDRTGRHHRPAASLWYLGPDGSLGDQLPAQAGSSSFRYDPADPTPSVGGPVLSGTAGSVDNARLEARPDVLTFTSAAAHRRPGDPRPGQRPAADPRQQSVPRRVRPAVRRRPARALTATSATA